MTTPSFLPRRMRRALARISVTVVPGVSSMTMSSLESCSVASRICGHCSARMLPERISCRPMRALAASRRCAISVLDISSEKSATDAPAKAAFVARLSAKDVLPTPGRAPMTTIWPGRSPSRQLSMDGKPVWTPRGSSLLSAAACSSS